MPWLKRPVFSEDGTSCTFENWKEVEGPIITIGPISFEEMKRIWWKNEAS